MIDIVNGMKNLEQNGILHRDLACRNVLVTEDQTSLSNTTKYQAKLSDFGNYFNYCINIHIINVICRSK